MSKAVIEKLVEKFGDAIVETTDFRGDETVVINRERIVEVCRWLKETSGLQFAFLMDLCGVDSLGLARGNLPSEHSEREGGGGARGSGFASPNAQEVGGAGAAPPMHDATRAPATDYPGRDERLEVVYHLYSLKSGKRIRLKVRLCTDDPVVESVTGIWAAANWFERECFDLFGVRFAGHPYLRRLLTYEEFEGHALRKDYPRNKRQKIPTPDPLLQ